MTVQRRRQDSPRFLPSHPRDDAGLRRLSMFLPLRAILSEARIALAAGKSASKLGEAVDHEVVRLLDYAQGWPPDERKAIGRGLQQLLHEAAAFGPDRSWQAALVRRHLPLLELKHGSPPSRPAPEHRTQAKGAAPQPTAAAAPRPASPRAMATGGKASWVDGLKRSLQSLFWRPEAARAESVGHPRDGRTPQGLKEPLSRLQGPLAGEAMSTLGWVTVNAGGKVQRKPFRASVLHSGEGLPPLWVGSAIGGGTFGKVVPMAYLSSHGELTRAVGKIMRKEPPRNLAHKPPTDRFGRMRSVVGTDQDFENELRLQEVLGGPVKVLGSRAYESKRLMVLTSMDMSVAEAVRLLAPNERSRFARDVMVQLAGHYADIHGKGYLHGDGKLHNALIRFADGVAAHSDFGGALALGPDGRVKPGIMTLASPEVFGPGKTISAKHDVYTLGLSGLTLLNGGSTSHAPFGLALDREGRVDSAASARRLQRLSAFRRAVLRPPAQYRRPEDAIDPVLFQRAVAAGDPTARALNEAFRRDPTLMSYILADMLNPNEAARPTSAQAAGHLRRIQKGRGRDTERVYRSLSERSANMHEAQDKLMRVAELHFGR